MPLNQLVIPCTLNSCSFCSGFSQLQREGSLRVRAALSGKGSSKLSHIIARLCCGDGSGQGQDGGGKKEFHSVLSKPSVFTRCCHVHTVFLHKLTHLFELLGMRSLLDFFLRFWLLEYFHISEVSWAWDPRLNINFISVLCISYTYNPKVICCIVFYTWILTAICSLRSGIERSTCGIEFFRFWIFRFGMLICVQKISIKFCICWNLNAK